MKKVIKYYLHGNKEDNHDIGTKLGLSEHALKTFSYTCYEVELDLEVDLETGDTRIVGVDGVQLSQEQ